MLISVRELHCLVSSRVRAVILLPAWQSSILSGEPIKLFQDVYDLLHV